MRTITMMASLLLAAPATAQFIAQPAPPRRAVPPISGSFAGPARELDRARDRIRDARDDRRLNRGEARRYRREASLIGAMSERFGSDGLSVGERQELETRARVLADRAALAGRSRPAGN